MTNEKNILNRLEKIFRMIFDDYTIKLSRETKVSDIEEWDSLNQIKIMLACEKEFKVKLNARDINLYSKVGEILDHINYVM